MSNVNKVWDILNTAAIVSDPAFDVAYANQRAYELFDELKISGVWKSERTWPPATKGFRGHSCFSALTNHTFDKALKKECL